MNQEQTNKIVIITGASRGIGAATARLASEQGWSVVINYMNSESEAREVEKAITKNGGEAWCIQCDVASEDSVVAMFDAVRQRYGRLDGLVNNAGILESQMRVEDMDGGRIDRVFATNVKGSILCAREGVRMMSTKHGGDGGAIVNVSSAASRLGSANEYVDYAASKGAIDTFTIGLSREVADQGIRVNAVRPGFIETEIHARGGQPDRLERIRPNIPLKRPGSAEEVAHAICWLLSDESSYSTGAMIEVSGGR